MLDSAASAFARSFSDSLRPPEGVAVPEIAEASESERFLGFMTCKRVSREGSTPDIGQIALTRGNG